MSAATVSTIQIWLMILVSLGTLTGWIRVSGANDRVQVEHERRISTAESEIKTVAVKIDQEAKERAAKLEAIQKELGVISGDIKVVRAITEKSTHP